MSLASPSRRGLCLGLLGAAILLQTAVATYAPASVPTAIDLLEKQAEAGDASAQQQLGMSYYNGQDRPKDYAQAFTWCLKAAKQGNVQAELNVAYLYLVGQGVPKDEALSLRWYLGAANQGNSDAERMVGNYYLLGPSASRDPAQAMQWYRKAAIQGDNAAKIRLGNAYLEGNGVPQDLKTGFTYLLSAGANGFGAYGVAQCYQKGLFVSPDSVQAYAWALHASHLIQTPDLSRFMASLKASLIAEQIQEAQQELADLDARQAGEIQTSHLASVFSTGESSLIHFKWVENMILIPLQTRDGQPAYLGFDTGAAQSMVSERFATKMGLAGKIYMPVLGIGRNIGLSTLSGETPIALPGLTFERAHLYILPDFDFDQGIGEPIVGFLGSDLLKDLVVRIDFVNQTIEFTRPANFHPGEETGTALPLSLNKMGPLIEGKVLNHQVEATGDFLVDTGDDSIVQLTKLFQERNPKLDIVSFSQSGSSGIGGTSLSSTGRCTGFQIGPFILSQPVVDLNHSTQGIYVSMNGGTIGNEIWRRFDLTLDYPDRKLFLRPNSQIADPFPSAGAGMHVVARGDDYKTFTVLQVLPGSPAERAGFQAGDLILQVDGKDRDTLNMAELFSLLHTAGSREILIQRQNRTFTLRLQLEDIPFPR